MDSNPKLDVDSSRPPVTSKPQWKGNGSRSKAKVSRDKTRVDDMRKRKGEEAMQDLQKELDKRLHFGFSTEFRAALTQANNVTDQAQVLAITTRAIGLYTQAVFTKTQQTVRNLPACTPYDHYRVSLAQHEARCIAVQKQQVMPYNSDNNNFARHTLTVEQREVIAGNAVNFGPISNIINAVGNFEYNNNTYYPRVPHSANPEPHLVTFSNLRRTVEQMSMRGTPQHQRLSFYLSNPLPFARWGPALAIGQRRGRVQDHHPDWPLLENPNDFMPEDYGIEDLEADCNRVRNYLNYCARKSVKYVDNSSLISFKGDLVGSPTLLISNYLSSLRNPDLPPGDIDFTVARFPEGDLDQFWAPCKLDNAMTMLGTLQLSGEIPAAGLPLDTYGVRLQSNARIRYDHRWNALVQNFLA